MPDIIGVTFPILKWNIDRFFKEKKTVFIKPATIFKELKAGQKFIFYQSREDTGYAGEATIKSITICDDPMDFFDIFGEKIFLNKDEVKNFIMRSRTWKIGKKRHSTRVRRKRPWIAIELKKIKKYSEVMKIDGFVPASGRYIKKENY